jgi:hypothetical protein
VTKWLTLYTALAALGLLIIGHSLTRANEIEVGQGLVCDNAVEVHKYLAVYKDDAQKAVEQVNLDVGNPTACILGAVAYIRGETEDTVRNKEGTWKVTAILVVAVYLPHGWQQIAPHVFWTALMVAERGA